MTLADAFVLLGVAVAWFVYALEREWSDRRDLESALNVLTAIRDAVVPWGDLHFQAYTAATATTRAQLDYDSVMAAIGDRVLGQVWQVPTEPLAALIANPATGGLIRARTVRAAVIALRQMNTYNQVVGQQTQFNALHLVEIKDPATSSERLTAIADGAHRLSLILHRDAIGDARWWEELKRELDLNIEKLVESRSRPWWARVVARWQLLLGVVLVGGSLVAVVIAAH